MVDNLLERHEALGLEADIDDQILFGLLDDLAGDDLVSVGLDGGGFGGLLALKGGQGSGKIVGWLGVRSMSLRQAPVPARWARLARLQAA